MNTIKEKNIFGDRGQLFNIISTQYLHFLLILFIILVTYKDLFSIYFLSDDFDLLLGKSSWMNPAEGFFRPIPHFIMVLFYKIFGLNPLPFQMLSLFIHYLNAIFIYLIIKRLISNNYISLIAGILFSVSFLINEAIFWISGITSLLIAMFYLLSIYLYLNFLEKKKMVFYILAVLSFVGALLSKENAVTLPFVLLVVDFFYSTDRFQIKKLWKSFIRLCPFFILLGVFLFVILNSLTASVGNKVDLGYHNIRNFRFLLLSLFTFNVFYDVPFLIIDSRISNLFSKTPGTTLIYTGSHLTFVFTLIIGFILLVVFFYLVLKGNNKIKLALLVLIISFGPFVFSFHARTIFGGFYRYPLRWYYLPAGIFLIFFGIMLNSIYIYFKKKKKFKPIGITLISVLIFSLAISNLMNTQARAEDWMFASGITKQIIADVKKVPPHILKNRKLVIFNLPDNSKGAYIFRNGFLSIVEILNPGITTQVIKIPQSSLEFFQSKGGVKYKDCMMMEYKGGHLSVIYVD